MLKKFIDTFKGTGAMIPFVDQTNEICRCMNNISVVMPTGYSGVAPSLVFKEGALVFDFGDALVFTLKNIRWNLIPSGYVVFDSATAQVVNGKLVITVTAHSTCP